MKNRTKILITILAAALFLAGCAQSSDSSSKAEETSVKTEKSSDTAVSESVPDTDESTVDEKQELDYLVLVNKQNKLPDYWEDTVEIVHTQNSLGDDVEVEKRSYDAYLELKSALEADGVFVDLDSAYRSVADQEDIVVRFTEQYGEDYVKQYVAVPGFSEHHTGLALDLYLNIDGEDVYLNEDMVEYPEIWAKIHEKLADYGFILRYMEGKEDITGYSYEPWHIRYVGSPEIAKEITDKGLTLEEYLGKNTADSSHDLSIQNQKTIDSPEWLTKLDAVKDTDQIIVVAGVGDTTAYVSMHEKNADGKWEMILQMPGYIGLEGMGDADCEHAVTPVGTFTVGKAFGIADDPGCQLGYTKVTEDDYWSGDSREGMHFNEFVNINDVPGLDPEECEHLIDYTYEYQYCLDMGYNTECIPEEGSCFFFHCMSLVKPYTGGCVAVNEATMKLIMQKIKPGCKITIDTADALGIDLDEARTTANKLV